MMVPLDELIRLKEKYQFRILVDESNSLGVLGETGRGITEHFKVPVSYVTLLPMGKCSHLCFSWVHMPWMRTLSPALQFCDLPSYIDQQW